MTNGELMRKEDALTQGRENGRKLIFSIQIQFRTFKIVIYVIFVDAHYIMTSLSYLYVFNKRIYIINLKTGKLHEKNDWWFMF